MKGRRHAQFALLMGSIAVLAAAAGAYVWQERTSSAETPAQAYLARTLPTTSEFQRNLLSDGEVDFDEHEFAIDRTIACVEATGATVEVDPSDGRSPTRFTVSVATGIEADRTRVEIEACQREFMTEVNFFYANSTFSREAADERDAAIRDCLVSEGLPSARSAYQVMQKAADDPRSPELYYSCQQAVDGEAARR